jgi:hypothetical protein
MLSSHAFFAEPYRQYFISQGILSTLRRFHRHLGAASKAFTSLREVPELHLFRVAARCLLARSPFYPLRLLRRLT